MEDFGRDFVTGPLRRAFTQGPAFPPPGVNTSSLLRMSFHCFDGSLILSYPHICGCICSCISVYKLIIPINRCVTRHSFMAWLQRRARRRRPPPPPAWAGAARFSPSIKHQQLTMWDDCKVVPGPAPSLGQPFHQPSARVCFRLTMLTSRN